jgi:thiamine-phosphate pyrophosphorylase
MRLPSPLLFIADMDEAGGDLLSILEAALKGGCRWVMLRGVKQSRANLMATGSKAKTLCARHQAKFYVSRDPIAARSLKADGLHMPSNSRFRKIPGLMLGQSCHNLSEIKRAVANGADYVFLSPVFPTPSKPGYGPALGLAKLKALIERSPVPVCALGGITPENAVSCLKTGAKAVVAMGGILRSPDPQAETRAYLSQLG